MLETKQMEYEDHGESPQFQISPQYTGAAIFRLRMLIRRVMICNRIVDSFFEGAQIA